MGPVGPTPHIGQAMSTSLPTKTRSVCAYSSSPRRIPGGDAALALGAGLGGCSASPVLRPSSASASSLVGDGIGAAGPASSVGISLGVPQVLDLALAQRALEVQHLRRARRVDAAQDDPHAGRVRRVLDDDLGLE